MSDSELLELLKKSNYSTALTVIYERYVHLVFGVCLKYLKNKQDAEDTTLKIFESLQEKTIRFTIINFKSWLHQTTKNECLMALRKKNHEQSITEVISPIDEEEIIIQADYEKQLTKLEQILTTLKEEQRICIEMFYLQNKSYQQISEETAFSIQSIKSFIQNGKRNLKIRLEKHEDTE